MSTSVMGETVILRACVACPRPILCDTRPVASAVFSYFVFRLVRCAGYVLSGCIIRDYAAGVPC